MLSPLFVERARALIAADTVSARGNVPAADLLQPLYEQAGLPVQRQVVREGIDGAPAVEHANIVAGPGGASGPGGVLLVTHTDTVPAGPPERWTETGGDPRRLTEKDGFFFGLGVADVKLDALCKIEAATRLKGRKLQRPFWLCGTFAEEVGLRGARHLVKSDLFTKTIAPTQVLCGEPSELGLIHAHKGFAVVRVTVTDTRPAASFGAASTREFAGKAAHSSTPHLGVNAIQLALAALDAPVRAIRGGAAANVVPARCGVELGGEGHDLRRALEGVRALHELWQAELQRLLPREDARFDPPGAVGGLNVIESEGAAVHATMDARLLPAHDPDELLQSFERAARPLVQRLGLELSIRVDRNAAGMAMNDDAPLVRSVGRVLSRLGLEPRPRAKPTSTEAGIFFRAGCEAVVIGPGRSTGNAHTANERIELAQLARAIELYEALLLELCGG